VKRPFWLTKPCPEWCIGRHHTADHPEDRYHHSALLSVPMTLDKSPGDGQFEEINLSLYQGYRDAEPVVEVGFNHGTRGHFAVTLTETNRLGYLLSELYNIAKGTSEIAFVLKELEDMG
jgi:hypothetical protein